MPLLVDVRKLAVIDQLVHIGAQNVASSFGALAGVETDVEVPEHEMGIELRTFLVPSPGSFVNLLDTIDLDSLSTPEGGFL